MQNKPPQQHCKDKPKKSLIGGQALMEGVMMRSNKNMALAVRDPSGNIVIDSKKLKGANAWYKKVPILRGVVAFVNSLFSSVGTLLKSAEVQLEDTGGSDDFVSADSQNSKNASNSKAKKETKGMSKGATGVLMTFSMLLGLLLGVGLFFAVPFLISGFLQPLYAEHALASVFTALIEGGIRIVLFVAYLGITVLLKDIKRMYGYHGAEHRVIACFEKNLDLNVKNAQSCSTRHNRCGTTFLFFVMMIAILIFALVTWATDAIVYNAVGQLYMSLPGSYDLQLFGCRIAGDYTPEGYRYVNATLNYLILYRTGSGILSTVARFGIRFALLPIVAGLSFELLRFLAWLPDNKATRILTWPLRAPGLALQRLTTFIPDDDMTEVALAAFLEVQAMDNNADLKPLKFGQFRYSSLRAEVENKLRAIDLDEIEVNAETDWIFVEVTGYKRGELSKLKIITFEQYKRIIKIVFGRTGNKFNARPIVKNFIGPIPQFKPKPLFQVLGFSYFLNEKVNISNAVLTPRPETEILASEAIKQVVAKMEKSKDGIVDVLDLCTGSGAIALALSKNTNANITASDICDKALKVAQSNLNSRESVSIIKSDLFENLTGKKFDIIVSNPPYIPTNDIADLDTAVKDNEPHLALDGGVDGLDFYKKIAKEVKEFLAPKGVLLLEFGINQASEIKELLTPHFKNIEIIKDLNGIERIIVAS